jgi:hypothetical protein
LVAPLKALGRAAFDSRRRAREAFRDRTRPRDGDEREHRL